MLLLCNYSTYFNQWVIESTTTVKTSSRNHLNTDCMPCYIATYVQTITSPVNWFLKNILPPFLDNKLFLKLPAVPNAVCQKWIEWTEKSAVKNLGKTANYGLHLRYSTSQTLSSTFDRYLLLKNLYTTFKQKKNARESLLPKILC